MKFSNGLLAHRQLHSTFSSYKTNYGLHCLGKQLEAVDHRFYKRSKGSKNRLPSSPASDFCRPKRMSSAMVWLPSYKNYFHSWSYKDFFSELRLSYLASPLTIGFAYGTRLYFEPSLYESISGMSTIRRRLRLSGFSACWRSTDEVSHARLIPEQVLLKSSGHQAEK